MQERHSYAQRVRLGSLEEDVGKSQCHVCHTMHASSCKVRRALLVLIKTEKIAALGQNDPTTENRGFWGESTEYAHM